jgi:hypothetical protein
MPTQAYVVRPHHPWRVRIFVGVAVVAVLLGGKLLFALGHAAGYANFDEMSARAEHRAKVNQALRDELAELVRQRDQLARVSSLDRDASKQVQRALGQQQSELADLREELAFYRAIAVTEDFGQALRLLTFRIRPEPKSADRYAFTLVVTRVRRDDDLTSAEVRLQVLGSRDGALVRLLPEQLGGAAGAARNFRFRNFHRVEGEVVLPPEFEPQQVVVRLTALGEANGKLVLERAYPWPLR